MGVAGCGKSTLAAAAAQALGLRYVEGDDFHSAASVAKMRAGQPLKEGDRADWLARLIVELRGGGVALSCSALRRAHRESLRAAAPGLRFAYLEITPALSAARAAARGADHFFPPALVQSQFESLEPPSAEAGVLWLSAEQPAAECLAQLRAWWAQPAGAGG